MQPHDQDVEAIIPILEDPANADRTSDEIAEIILDTLDRTRATRERLAVVLQYTLDQGENLHHAVLGPFPVHPERAQGAAVGIAGRPTQPGQGRFMLVPAYPSTHAAWTALARTHRERQRELALALAAIRRDSEWNPWAPHGPVCHCGLCHSGQCPVHPTRR